MTLVTTEVLAGVECDIIVTKHGWFEVYPSGSQEGRLGYADTMERAVAQARPKAAARRVKVKVDFFTQNGERGVATGFHAKNGNIMATIGSASVQLKYGAELIGLDPEMPHAKLDRMLSCRAEARRLVEEAQKIQHEYRLDLKEVVQSAVDKAVAAKERADA